MNQAQGRRISNFPGQTVPPTDAYFTYVINGVNYKIAYPDLLASLGATGTIVQEGDPLGVPILDPQGSVNAIRNFEPGPGIQAAISGQNGLVVSHNFTADVAGLPVLVNAATVPLIRSMLAGPGIQLDLDGEAIKVSLAVAPVATRVVLVNQLSDFPAPVAGVITLATRTQYFVYNDINLGTNRLVFEDGATLQGASPSVVTLTYTGAGNMVTALNATISISDITLDAALGNIVSFVNNAATKNITLQNVIVNACNNFGTVNGARAIMMFLVGVRQITTKGLTVQGTIALFCNLSFVSWVVGAGPAIDVTPATSIAFFNCDTNLAVLTLPASVFIKGNGDVNVTSAHVFNARLTNPGAGTPLSGVSPSNIRWTFNLNDLIQDTQAIALIGFTNNAVPTVIAVAGTPVLVAGVFTTHLVNFFTANAAGRITYAGAKPVRATMTAVASVVMAAGAVNNVNLYLAINGVVVTATQITGNASTANATALPIVWSAILNPGDFIELFVANPSDADDITVTDVTFRAVV